MPKIFISYRREDAPGQAGRLSDRLKQEFGNDNVFIDVDTLLPGDDFVDAIGETLGRCDLMIAIIGPGWLTATDSHGRVRLEDPADFVRVEVQTALDRHIRTVPVLVNHGLMPREDQLPESLKPLIRRQAIELSDVRWTSDVGALVEKVTRATAAAEPARRAAAALPRKRRFWPITIAAAAVVASGVFGLLFVKSTSPRVAPSAAPETVVASAAEASPAVSVPARVPAATESVAKKSVAAPPPPPSRGASPVVEAARGMSASRTATANPAPPDPAVRSAASLPSSRPVVLSCREGETDPTRCSSPCEAGDVRSCVNLAFMYETGRGVARDPQRAVATYQRWCSVNNQYACAHLGRAYVLGNGGLVKDEARALQLFSAACEADDAFGCSELGVMYSSGLGGVARRPQRAAALFQRGCDAGVAIGCANLGIYTMAGRGGVVRDEARALALYQRSCDGGASAGCVELGLAYHTGRSGLARDEPRAAELFQRACSESNLLGCTDLGVLYVNGDGVPKDVARGVILYERACAGREPTACLNLGRLFEKGIGVSRDGERAASYYQQACNAGNIPGCDAMRRLNGARRR
jgi:TPR repeat protein